MYIRRIAMVGVLAGTMLGAVAAPSYASTGGGGTGPVCTRSNINVDVHLHGMNGGTPYMVITVNNDGDCGIRAMIHCANVTQTKSPIVYGASVVSGQTSTATCPTNYILVGSSGWQWWDAYTWHTVETYTA